MATKLYDLAKVLRSKNSGPFEITLDIIFSNKDENDGMEEYVSDDRGQAEVTDKMIKNSEIINKKLISELYNVSMDDISVLVNYDQAYAIKITMKRLIDSGTIGDTDVYGAQQHAPLMNIIIP